MPYFMATRRQEANPQNLRSEAVAKFFDKDRICGNVKQMKLSLPSALEDFASSQVKSGEFDDAGEVVSEALRLLRKEQEAKAMAAMRCAFAGVDSLGLKGEPAAKDRALIHKLIRNHRSGKRRA
jgi:putative addiction module CopG family antidote